MKELCHSKQCDESLEILHPVQHDTKPSKSKSCFRILSFSQLALGHFLVVALLSFAG